MSETPEVGGSCNICGGGVRYGSRHVVCDKNVMVIERERDELRVLWERDSKALGVAIGQRDTARAVAEDNRALYVTAEAQRDELAAALREYVAAQDECRGFDWCQDPPRVVAVCALLDAAEENIRALLARLGEGGEG